MTMAYWILKSEPDCYSWEEMVSDGTTFWNGVRNFQARKNLQSMHVGDLAFFYHSGPERRLMGLVKIVKSAYPDPTADEPGWVMVDVTAVKPLKNPVGLALIKSLPELSDLSLVRQGRLSVSSVQPKAFERLLQLAETTV